MGIVYGTLFPDRVRALQLSSIVDPDAYTTDTRSHIADTAQGTEEVLTEFLRLCAAAGPRYCAFASLPESSAADLRVRFTGPWAQQSPVPALLLNNRFDPATPLTSARRAAQAMGTARLVVVTDGYGHEPAGECATTLRERYLIDLRIPEPDTTCTAGQTPFAE